MVKIIAGYALLVGFVAAMGALAAVADVPMEAITQDPATYLDEPIYIGLLSGVGIILWSAAAGALLVAYLSSPGLVAAGVRSFLLEAFLLTAVFLIDDAFLVHERIAPRLMGVSETMLPVVYGALVAIFIVRHRRLISTTVAAPLLLAFVFGGLSILIDVLGDMSRPVPMHFLIEDGAKFVAIGSWLMYFGSYCVSLFRSLRTARAEAAFD